MPIEGGVSLSPAYIVIPITARAYTWRVLRSWGTAWETSARCGPPTIPPATGSIFAVSGRASQFSDWPDRNDLEPGVDGFHPADECAHAWEAPRITRSRSLQRSEARQGVRRGA